MRAGRKNRNKLLHLPRVATPARNMVTTTGTEKLFHIITTNMFFVFLKTARKKVCVCMCVSKGSFACPNKPSPFPCPSAQVSRDDADFLI